MTKLLYVGDLHIRGANPRNRKDNYKEALKRKLQDIHNKASQYGADAILCAGDIFDKPEVSAGILLEFADVFAASPVPWYTTPGNHDLHSYNLSTYYRTSLALLERLVSNFHVIKSPDTVTYIGAQNVAVTFAPYTSEMDRDGWGYSPTVPTGSQYTIHVAHGMLLDHEPPFDRYTLIKDVETTADLVLTGHDHIGYGIINRMDGKTFCNIGSLTRLSATKSEMARDINTLLITVDGSNAKLDILKVDAPLGNEILDRSRIEAEQQRQYAMESFTALVQGGNGEVALLDVDTIVNQMAKRDDIPKDIVKIALDRIYEAQVSIG